MISAAEIDLIQLHEPVVGDDAVISAHRENLRPELQVRDHLRKEIGFVVNIGTEQHHRLIGIAAAGILLQLDASDLNHMAYLGSLLACDILKHRMIRLLIVEEIARDAEHRREGGKEHDHQCDGDCNGTDRQQGMALLRENIPPRQQGFKLHCVHRLTVRSSHRARFCRLRA